MRKTGLLLQLVGLAGVTALIGCTGEIGSGPNGNMSPVGAGGDGTGPDNVMNGAGTGPDVTGQAGGGPVEPPDPPSSTATDPGNKLMHRLNNDEYNNTVRDLLGTTLRPGSSFSVSERGVHEFDNIADSLGITTVQFEGFFNAAEDLAEDLQANPALWAAYATCEPAAPGDVACATQIANTFGARAYRRPVLAAEAEALVGVYSAAIEEGETHADALRHMLITVLTAPQFIYRIELEADPTSTVPHPVDAYALASRLSYFQWSTMPDQTLFDLAASGELLDPVVLSAQVDRMLDDPKSLDFVRRFAGQWLGIEKLGNHAVDVTEFPMWDNDLRSLMVQEANAYFAEFLYRGRTWDQFLTAEINYVNDRLATHYGMAAPNSASLVQVSDASDERMGFLGLGAFLTVSSFEHRTAPTLRAKWVQEYLLCSPPPPPPPIMIPELEELEGEDLPPPENVRARLELHRANPACSGCHAALDPIGLGLENFDAVGAYRTTYDNGDVIDPTGTLVDGTTFASLRELAAVLSADPRLASCAAEKMWAYGLGRGKRDEAALKAMDGEYLAQIVTNWQSSGGSLRELMKAIVINDTFRFRHGEAAGAAPATPAAE